MPACSGKIEVSASGTKRFRRLHGPGLYLPGFSLRPEASAIRPRSDAALRQNFSSDAAKILRRGPAESDCGGKRSRVSDQGATDQRLHADSSRGREMVS